MEHPSKCLELETRRTGQSASPAGSVEANAKDGKGPHSEAVKAFASEVQGFCNRMLNSPACKRAQGIPRRAHGHDIVWEQEEKVLRGPEERGSMKRSKGSASAEVLKERFEKRQTRAGGSPEDGGKARKVTTDGSKKVKKKKV
jgi:hypothetical protein